jgi:cytochrome b561
VESDVADDPLGAEIRYDRTGITLHWVTAVLVILLWVIAHFIDDFPRGAPRIAVRSVHITLGVILISVLIALTAWRLRSGRRLPPANAGWIGSLARVVHFGLYALVAAVLALGIANVWIRGDSYFGLFAVPKFDPGNKELKETVENLHETVANILLITAGAHALAALAHHFWLRDGVLRRMLPRASSK